MHRAANKVPFLFLNEEKYLTRNYMLLDEEPEIAISAVECVANEANIFK